jgi:lipopolysaccharide transport system ATP-binding protein
MDAVVVEGVGKRYRSYGADRPWTIQEALLGGLGKLRPRHSRWAVRYLSFRVEQGETLAVIGRNGAGKSTLLRLLGGISQPDEGKVQIRGRLSGLLELGAGFHGDLTGRENAFITGVVAGLTRKEVARQFESIVEFAELQEVVDSPLRTYSSGMQLRLAFAVAVHVRPDVLLVDEVLAVGDTAFQSKCVNRMLEFKRRGCAITLVTHDMQTVRKFADRAILLCEGMMMAQGAAPEVVDLYLSGAVQHA